MAEPVEPVLGVLESPISEPQAELQRALLATAILIDDYVESEPERFHPHLRDCILVPRAGTVVVGTRCHHPLMTREIANTGRAVGRDAVVVRVSDVCAPAMISFDVHLLGRKEPLLDYRMWMPQPTGAAFLIPAGEEDLFVRLGPNGPNVCDHAPFADDIGRHRGLVWGSEFLSVTIRGWF